MIRSGDMIVSDCKFCGKSFVQTDTHVEHGCQMQIARERQRHAAELAELQRENQRLRIAIGGCLGGDDLTHTSPIEQLEAATLRAMHDLEELAELRVEVKRLKAAHERDIAREYDSMNMIEKLKSELAAARRDQIRDDARWLRDLARDAQSHDYHEKASALRFAADELERRAV